MRSRYAAFALDDAAYVLRSWHPDTRPAGVEPDPNLRWTGLQVLGHAAVADSSTPRAWWSSGPTTATPAGPARCSSAAASCATTVSGCTGVRSLPTGPSPTSDGCDLLQVNQLRRAGAWRRTSGLWRPASSVTSRSTCRTGGICTSTRSSRRSTRSASRSTTTSCCSSCSTRRRSCGSS